LFFALAAALQTEHLHFLPMKVPGVPHFKKSSPQLSGLHSP
jgi:hypothetical protein